MLKRLYIRNYLLIDELDLPLGDGLTIMTGGTGSGKSILIGALGLAMGERADTSVVRDAAARCVIELEVDLSGRSLQEWFNAQEIPYEPVGILRRQIDPGGRSRAFVNDTPVRTEQLRELGAQLLHVHSQHHTLLLNDPRFQLGLVDHWAGNGKALAGYRAAYGRWQEATAKLDELREEDARSSAELDFVRFQLDELERASLVADEQEEIERDLLRAENAEELLEALGALDVGIGGEQGLLGMLSGLEKRMERPARADAEVGTLLERLRSARIELQDIGNEAADLAGGIEMDPKRAEQLRTRLDLLISLQQKHRRTSVAELIDLREEFRAKTEGIISLAERIPALEQEVETLRKQIMEQAAKISKKRIVATEALKDRVEVLLRELGMADAVFRFEHRTTDPGPQGIDVVRALFSANSDRAPAPLNKVASGGELSRVMLALISLAADQQGLSTVIFDEIDTGVSGDVADRVGEMMARMSEARQVLAITHLPQIASKADSHLLVSKRKVKGEVLTRIEPVEGQARVEAIARMLSGRELNDAALENARVLLGAGA